MLGAKTRSVLVILMVLLSPGATAMGALQSMHCGITFTLSR